MACLPFGFVVVFKTVYFAERFWLSGDVAQHVGLSDDVGCSGPERWSELIFIASRKRIVSCLCASRVISFCLFNFERLKI